jgi:hypothetical protein
MPNIGHYIRDRLSDAPATASEIYKAWRVDRPRKGTYHSFARFFYVLKRLGWITPTGETFPAVPRGMDEPQPNLPEAVEYALTPKGEEADFIAWGDPIGILWPNHAAELRGAKPPTGKPRGRPKKQFV